MLVEITVKTSNNSQKRVYDKKQVCPFCHTPQSKLPRHMYSKHPEERDVAHHMAATDQQTRTLLMTKMRNLGNHLHNKKVLADKKGELFVVYRPSQSASLHPYNYVPCSTCLGWYRKRELWKHKTKCVLNPDKEQKKNHVKESRALLADGKTPRLAEVFSGMREDNITFTVRGESTLARYADFLLQRTAHYHTKLGYVRNSLRELGRLTLTYRELNSSSASIKDMLDPRNFQKLITATQNVAGYNENSVQFKKPSLALRIGHSLKKCAMILKASALEDQDRVSVQQINDFIALYDLRWSVNVSANAHRTLDECKRNAIKLVPLSTDVKIMSDYLKRQIHHFSHQLETVKERTAYHELQKALLCLIIMFNRRRAGEASRIQLEDYFRAEESQLEFSELGLSSLEQALCQSFSRIEIVGKRGRTVPVLLTQSMKQALDLLVNARPAMKLERDNKFLFANVSPGSLTHVRGTDVVRQFSAQSGVERPEAMRSTSLRKQIATMTQIVNLKDNELDILASFMGHDVRVHREYYRIPQEAAQVAKVTKLLLSLEAGQIQEHAGKSLADIDVNLEEDLACKFYAKIDIETWHTNRRFYSKACDE